MQKRQLGKNGPQLSVIGLGTWAIGGPCRWGWGPQSDTDSIAAIRVSLEHGVNWIDTAPIYGMGHAEEVVGKAIAEVPRDSIFIATKCGLVWDERGKVRINLRPETIRNDVEQSLRRLKIDVIDLYQHHWPDPNTSVNDSWGELVRLREEGKVRYIGLCNYQPRVLEKCHKIHPVQSLQPPLSLVERDTIETLLPLCQKLGIGVVPYSPLQTGLLTGSFDKSRLAEGDWRLRDKHFQEPRLSDTLNLVEKLRPIAEREGFSIAQLAIAWVMAQPGVTSAIVGARNAQQALSNLRTAELDLSSEALHNIAACL